MLESIHIRGYRSLRDFRLKLDRLTVVTGQNGVGKSNLYRALALVQRMADGRFAESLASEGGMPSALWAGKRRTKEDRRICWKIKHSHFEFEHECGLIRSEPMDGTAFKTDPDIKLESLRYSEKGRLLAKRRGPWIDLRNPEGKMESQPLPMPIPESMLSQVRDGIRFPVLATAREMFLSWRFYHHFRTDPDSPMRRPQVGFWSPVLAHDGSNLAATLETIHETDKGKVLDEILRSAFPDLDWSATDETGRFQLQIAKSSIQRTFNASELSDGTLRFFCLAAALLSPHPPTFLVLNEPENSLHGDLIPALADLIASVPQSTQILLVTHSRLLADLLATNSQASLTELVTHSDETRKSGEAGGNRVWNFDD